MHHDQYFASPVRFDCVADKDGNAAFREASTTGSDIPLEIGNIYVRSENHTQGPERSIALKIEELAFAGVAQTFAEFLNFVNGQNCAAKSDAKFKNETAAKGAFPEYGGHVPGFDNACKPTQDEFSNRKTKVVAPHFLVDVTLSGFNPGEKVSGYLLFELKKPIKS
jgi:hypothetical protein